VHSWMGSNKNMIQLRHSFFCFLWLKRHRIALNKRRGLSIKRSCAIIPHMLDSSQSFVRDSNTPNKIHIIPITINRVIKPLIDLPSVASLFDLVE